MRYSPLFLVLIVFCSAASQTQDDGSFKKITAGTHHCFHEGGADEWFVYNPKNPTWVILSSIGKTETDTYVEVYHQGHKKPFLRSDDYINAQSMVRFMAEPDSVYFIRWRGIYATAAYEWDCKEESFIEGEHHSTALNVRDKIMDFQIPPACDVWYKYVSSGNQWVGIESSFYGYEVFQKSVDNKQLIQFYYSPFSASFSFSPKEEEVYYFHWKNERDSAVNLSWKLITKTPQNGKISKMSETLPIDEVTRFNPLDGIDYWYSFKADSIGQLRVGAEYDTGFRLEVWEKQSGQKVQVDFEESDWGSKYYCLYYKKDVEYILRFRNHIAFSFKAEKITATPGSTKRNPKNVEEGIHYAKTQYNTGEWFRYIPSTTSDVMITTQYGAFAETTIHLIDEAPGVILASDTTVNHEEKEGRVIFKAEKSLSYLIYIGNSNHSSIDGVYWDLKENPNFCSTPQPISSENSQALLGNTDYWFEYTASERSEINVTATGLENEKQYVDIEFYHSCDSLIDIGKDMAKIYLSTGEKILIKTKGHFIERFYNIAINKTEQSIGTKEFPLEITLGKHQIQNNKEHWFVYYPQNSGKIEIEMPNDLSSIPQVEIYRSYNNSKIVTTRSREFGKAAARCQPGEPLYIRWINVFSDVSFEWTITEKEPIAGDLITNAFEAQEGLNAMTKTNRMPTWYYYVPKSMGEIKISTCDLTDENTYISVYDSINQIATSIFNGNACGLQAEVLFDCHPNDTVYFIMHEDYSNNPYSFSFSETPLIDGSNLRNAKTAIEGVNELDFTKSNMQWLKYTPRKEKRIVLSNCGIETSLSPIIKVFRNNINRQENVESKNCGIHQKSIEFDINPDNTYYIQFELNANEIGFVMDWMFEETDFAKGTHCKNPLPIAEGLQAFNYENGQWFSYTAKSNAEITLSRCNVEDDIDTYLNPRIYKNCSQELSRVEITYCGSNMAHSFVALEDSTYFIFWSYSGDSQFHWELIESSYPDNGFCRDAKDVAIGINHAQHTRNKDVWYKFTAPHDGNIILNSVGLTDQDTEVVYYSGCSDGIEYTQIYSNKGYFGSDQAKLYWTCNANETYYVQWKGDNITAPYNWEFTFVAKGDSKEDPLEADLGQNERTVTDKTSQFFVFENSSEAQLFEITIPREEGKIRKLNILPGSDSWYDVISYNVDSAEAEIRRLYGGEYIVECISEPGDSFTWTIEKRYIDTLAVNTRLLGHSGFINDWFILSGEKDGFYTIESEKALKAYNDIDLYGYYLFNDPKMIPIPSNLKTPIYQLVANEEHYIKWAFPEKGKTDYGWSITQFHLSGSEECVEAQPARLGGIYSSFNSNSLIYKMRPDKSGRYIISANSEDLKSLGLERLNVYEGNCNNKELVGYADFSKIKFEETDIISIIMDSIEINTSYYLEWEFYLFNNQIKELSWYLEHDADYELEKQNPDSESFLIDKNPNNGHFEVRFPELSEDATLQIYNTRGERIYSKNLQSLTTQTTVNIPGSPTGIYFIRFINSECDETIKFIIKQD